MVFQGYNPSNWEAETGVQDQPVHNDLVSKKKKKSRGQVQCLIPIILAT
jgi:hypothetical protein